MPEAFSASGSEAAEESSSASTSLAVSRPASAPGAAASRRAALSLSAKLQMFIVALVAAIVLALSLLYLRTVVNTRFEDSLKLARHDALQVESFILERVRGRAAEQEKRPRTLDEVKQLWVEIVEQDQGLSTLLANLVGSSEAVVEVVVSGEDGRILTASLPGRGGQPRRELTPFEEVVRASLLQKLDVVLSSNEDFEVSRSLGIEGQPRPLFTVSVILSSVLLRNQLIPDLTPLLVVSAVSLLLSVLVAFVASKLAFRPLGRIAEIIDRIRRGEAVAAQSQEGQARELAAVESKLSLLGRQFRGAQDDASQLRGNIDQLLDRMEEVVLLFGAENQLIMAGAGIKRILGRDRWELLGQTVAEIFPAGSELGRLVQGALSARERIRDELVSIERSDAPVNHLLVSVEVMEAFPGRKRLGAMVTLRDAAPRRQLASELDISTRLAAISRLTSGAAHEIKNPLNSISLHLEVLRSLLEGASPDAEREIAVLVREINRLDRVVKSFLDFTRPVDLRLSELDLAALVEEVASLIRPDASRRGVEVAVESSLEEAPMRGDRDLLVQAILNVVVNGVEAMPNGGRLDLRVQESRGQWLVAVRDHGCGIPAEIRETIYNLYSSTKGKGSGIGLAMTFRIVQLHNGTIDFTSEAGQGTEFRLRFPASQSGDSSAGRNVQAFPSRA